MQSHVDYGDFGVLCASSAGGIGVKLKAPDDAGFNLDVHDWDGLYLDGHDFDGPDLDSHDLDGHQHHQFS